ncbi:MAG: exodeoxyribonuclease V subunit gamma [Alistipes sp.]|nr:exodeoxyribonuclease V subunit gamma [Alistipes sp.]
MRQTFLSEVAQQLYSRYGDDISSLTLVFPSQRARLFFSDALAKLIERPVWQPSYMSMDDIMRAATPLVTGDKVRILTELYKIYSTHHNEPFDKFYFWGEILLSDFDLIDKYMIDADMLFRNIYDLKVLESDLSYLTPEMRSIIHAFWSHFAEEENLSDEKRKFLDIWQSLAPIYHALHERLTQLQFAYSGMVYREAVANIESGAGSPDTNRHYVFIGFNALSECEKRMLKYLENNSTCDFFWDYDKYYTDNTEQEAGKFIRENIKAHKATLEINSDNFLSINKKISAISTVSNIAQCKYIPTLLSEISPSMTFDKDTAIVLTDESLLIPLLHSLPADKIDKINVTMGYPLRQTTAYSFVERLLELQKNVRQSHSKSTFYHVDTLGILSHPYLTHHLDEKQASLRNQIIAGRMLRVSEELFAQDDMLQNIFRPTAGWEELADYLINALDGIISASNDSGEDYTLKASYLAIISENISQLKNSLNKCDIEITTSIFTSLLKRHLQTIRIPFSGEPLEGLQIMGILETRNIDFKNVIILSMNDDNFPGKLTGNNSFIPYNLRAAYGMPTPEHHEGVYAYYFYRLIQRAERVDMLYCSHADDKTTGEQSRYIYQLAYESPYPICRLNIGVDVAATDHKAIVVEKDDSIMQRLSRYLDQQNGHYISPSALAPYISCPLKFYFMSIAKLRTTEELDEEVDVPMFGTILHNAMERLYLGIKGIADPKNHLEQLLKGDTIEQAVICAINKEFLKDEDYAVEDYSGSLILIKDVVSKYIRHNVIPYDIAHCGFALMGCEEKIGCTFALSDGREVNIGGKADRIDSLDNGNIRVVDYKTGRHPNLGFDGIDGLFHSPDRHQLNNIMQTMIYSMVLNRKYKRNVEPTLYYVQHLHKSNFSPHLVDSSKDNIEVDYLSYAEHFESELRCMLDELFDPSVPFTQCKDEDAGCCEYCDFSSICKR